MGSLCASHSRSRPDTSGRSDHRQSDGSRGRMPFPGPPQADLEPRTACAPFKGICSLRSREDRPVLTEAVAVDCRVARGARGGRARGPAPPESRLHDRQCDGQQLRNRAGCIGERGEQALLRALQTSSSGCHCTPTRKAAPRIFHGLHDSALVAGNDLGPRPSGPPTGDGARSPGRDRIA